MGFLGAIFTFPVCLSPSYRAHLLGQKPNFWTEGSLGHEKETQFFVFRNFEKWDFQDHFHFPVCLSPSYRGHLLAQEPDFWTEGSLGHEKETHFFVFRNFEKCDFQGHFHSKGVSPSYRAQLLAQKPDFWTEDPWDMRKKRIFLFFEILKNDIFRVIFVFHFRVCLSPSYRGHLLAQEPNFWTEGSLGHEKEMYFFSFQNFEK